MNKKSIININTGEKLNKFSQLVSTFESDINIYFGSGYYDAKSIMAVISIDRTKPVCVEIVSDDKAEICRFNEVMEEFK